MITGIIVENFKGIGERVEIELRPLTLLFGANGAGKSTIVEALSVLEDVLLNRHDRRGKSLERRVAERVGNIRDVVHEQDSGRKITLGVTISKDDDDEGDYFREFMTSTADFKNRENAEEEDSLQGFSAAKMPSAFSMGGLRGEDDATSLTVEVTLQEQRARHQNTLVPVVAIRQLLIGVNGRELVRLSGSGEESGNIETFTWQVDTDHPVLSDDIRNKGAGKRTLLVRMYQILPLNNDLPPLCNRYCTDQDGVVLGDDDGPLALSLNIAVLASLEAVESELSRHRRLGPMRMIPPHYFRPQPLPARDDWLTGQAAWDQLGYVMEDALSRINEWLGPDKLDSGIEVHQNFMVSLDEVLSLIEVIKETAPAFFDQIIRSRKLSFAREVCLRPIGTKYGGVMESAANLSPSQVGTGVSQIVPVVVACVNLRGMLVTIAQPELHLHPRLQVKLGDLFIDSISTHDDDPNPTQLIVETHSEHLILRLLRRVRETAKRCAPDGLELTSEDIVVYHVSQEQGRTVIRKLDIDANGEFVQPWPDDFFEIDFYERFKTGGDNAR